jgi:hypothetical protein
VRAIKSLRISLIKSRKSYSKRAKPVSKNNGGSMNQIKLSQIREKLAKIKDFDSLKSEIKKLIAEIDKFDFKKAIPEDKMQYIEKKFSEIMSRVQTLQTQVEKEYDRVLKKVEQGRADATKIVKDARAKVMKQRVDLEKMLQKNFDYFSKKAKTVVAAEEKNLKKTIKKIKKTAVAKATKTFNKKVKKTKTSKSTKASKASE